MRMWVSPLWSCLQTKHMWSLFTLPLIYLMVVCRTFGFCDFLNLLQCLCPFLEEKKNLFKFAISYLHHFFASRRPKPCITFFSLYCRFHSNQMYLYTVTWKLCWTRLSCKNTSALSASVYMRRLQRIMTNLQKLCSLYLDEIHLWPQDITMSRSEVKSKKESC